MFGPALIAGIVVFVTYYIDLIFGFIYTNKPIIIGAILGALLGDITTGIICGATYELVFIGAVTIGGSVPAEPGVGGAIGTALVILYKMSPEAALAVAVPAGLLVAQASMFCSMIKSFFNPLIDKAIENDDHKMMLFWGYVTSLTKPLVLGVITTVALYFGGDALAGAVEAMPAVVTGGISVASGMLAVVGFALLLRITWSRSLAVFFFLGALLAAYLNVPIMGIALLGVVYCIIQYFTMTSTIKLGDGSKEKGGLFDD